MSLRGKLLRAAEVSNVVAHITNGAKANEFLDDCFFVKLPVLVAVKFLRRAAYFALEPIALMYLLSQLIPLASWDAVTKAIAPRTNRDEVDLKFQQCIVIHNGCAG